MFFCNDTAPTEIYTLSRRDALPLSLTTEMHVNTYIYQGQVVRRQTGRHAAATPTPLSQLRCKDGKYVNASAARVTLRLFPALVEWMDSHGLAGDLAEERYLEPVVFSEIGRAHV